MKKVILLEDKIDRDSLKQANIDFNQYSNIEAVFGRNHCEKYLNNFDELEYFDTIIIHASIQFEGQENIIQKLKDYCKNKSLVIFSGGGNIGVLKNNTLEVTAKSLYENIPIFLEHYPETSHILMLAYGEHWFLNILLNTLEKLNILLEDKDENFEEDFDEFEDNFDFRKIKNILNEDQYKSLFMGITLDDYEINLSQIKTIKENLFNFIDGKINE